MLDREQDKKNLLNLKHGQSCKIAWSEEGGGEVWKIWDCFFLFEIPQYGGEGDFWMSGTEDHLDLLLNAAWSWT